MPPTKRGIYHNLKESKYVVSNTEIMLFFSGQLYLNNFIKKVEENRVRYRRQFEAGSHLNSDTLADIILYTEIEKRGFRVVLRGLEITCQESHEYALRRMTNKNTLNWFVMRKPKLSVLRQSMGVT